MSESVHNPPDVAELAEPFFDELQDLGQFELVSAGGLPKVYRGLLAHDDHMTVTLEAIHNSLVDVEVCDVHQQGDIYTRKILLRKQSDKKVALFGIMRMDLSQVDADVRHEIEEKGSPLGRILIRHHVMRHVELDGLYRVTAGAQLQELLQCGSAQQTYARTARIHVAGKPAVQLLEIVAPV